MSNFEYGAMMNAKWAMVDLYLGERLQEYKLDDAYINRCRPAAIDPSVFDYIIGTYESINAAFNH